MHFTHYMAIGLGGALGAIARVALAKVLPSAIMGIPASILSINLIGCFTMGILTELMALHWSISDTTRYFLISGVLGGFTTFSAFALEFGLLYEKQLYVSALIYATLSFFLSISAFFLALKIVRVLP
jgi:CrcB protein